jgi:malate permease and related proteins
LADILAVLTQNIFPIFLVAAFGYLVQRQMGVDKRALSSITFYCLSPCLVFSSLVNSELPVAELGGMALFTLVTVVAMGIIGLLLARLLRFNRTETAAFLIVLMFVNGGNYGMTLNLLRYGQDGLARAVVYYMTSTLLAYTIGVLVASMGRLSWRTALWRVLRLPPLHAAVLAVVVYLYNIPIPTPILRGIDVAGAGAIPVMLLLLGMQMADLRGRTALRLAVPAVGVRLVGGPLVGLLVATLLMATGLDFTGLTRSVAIIEASMPTAVFSIILATEFDLQPQAVTSIVVGSTLLSPLTVAATISLLGL